MENLEKLILECLNGYSMEKNSIYNTQMPFYRKRRQMRRRPRFIRKKRSFRRTGSRRMPRASNKVHLFKRTAMQILHLDDNSGAADAETGQWIYSCANNSILTGVAGYFKLDDLPGYTEFTNLYDSYKIAGIKIKWIYNRNSFAVSDPPTAFNYGLPNLYTCLDHDDGTPLTLISNFREYASFRVVRLNQHTMFVRPCVNQVIQSGAVTDVTRVVKSPWLDAGFDDVKHMAVKWAIELPGQVGTPTDVSWGTVQVYCTYYLAMRTPR